jgi:hypothetical protein
LTGGRRPAPPAAQEGRGWPLPGGEASELGAVAAVERQRLRASRRRATSQAATRARKMSRSKRTSVADISSPRRSIWSALATPSMGWSKQAIDPATTDWWAMGAAVAWPVGSCPSGPAEPKCSGREVRYVASPAGPCGSAQRPSYSGGAQAWSRIVARVRRAEGGSHADGMGISTRHVP